MLYGYFVQNDARFSGGHTLTGHTRCISYWDQPKLSRHELNQLLRRGRKDDVAFSVASFSGTPVQIIRAAIEEARATRTPNPRNAKNRRSRRAMLIGQASINLSANVLSALLGLLSVFVFTRLFSPHDYGIYLLGVGFAAVVSTFLVGWFRNLILSGHARNDGTDVRGLVISGYSICCLAAPAAYGLGRLVGLDVTAAMAAVVLSVAIGLFELTQDLVRARLLALTVMKATLTRAVAALGLGVVVALFSPTGFLLLLSSALAYMLAVLVQSRTAWRGTAVKFDAAGLAAVARQGLPLTLSLTLLAISGVTDRFMIANLVGAADAGRYVAGLDLVRQTLMIPAMSAAAAFFPLAVQIHANRGKAAVRSHLAECAELLLGITLPACLGFAVISPHVANVVLGVDFREVAADRPCRSWPSR